MNMKQFRPMLAINADIDNIKYPVIGNPKFDGIRCIIKDGKCLSRTLKEIPNIYVKTTLVNYPSLLLCSEEGASYECNL